MNRYPWGRPPRWWSPKPSLFWMRVWRPLRRFKQVREDRIRRIDVLGLEHVKRAIRQRHGVLIAGNHPGHADHHLLFTALEKLRRRPYVMTTWQVFQMAKPLERLQYRQHGTFSVDREGTDRQAFKVALSVLAEKSDPLVIFPEGEVYHLNERVVPFREGCATLALAAARRGGRPVSCVPAALKYYYVRDPTPQLERVMDRLEATRQWPPQRGRPLLERLYALGGALLADLEREYLREEQSGALESRRRRLMQALLGRVERRYGVSTAGELVPDRIKRLRQLAIARQGTARSGPESAEAAEDLEDLYRVSQIYSYPADYLSERPTIERIAETIDKLEEDVLGASTASVRGVRRATITFGEPIVVTPSEPRSDAQRISDELRRRIQALLYVPAAAGPGEMEAVGMEDEPRRPQESSPSPAPASESASQSR